MKKGVYIFKQIMLFFALIITVTSCSQSDEIQRSMDFTSNWKFMLGDCPDAINPEFDDTGWRRLDLPHDWSIEGDFSADNPSTALGGALPGGIGWYRKTFLVPEAYKDKKVYIDFDGVYMNSEVFINGHSLGIRPYGYISFRYDLTPYLNFGEDNVLTVKVDNEKQPNSRWYAGCGIYRNVWLTVLEPVHVDHWGTFVTTPIVSSQQANVKIETTVKNNSPAINELTVVSILLDDLGKEVGRISSPVRVNADDTICCVQNIDVANPNLWSVDHPYLYKLKTELRSVDRLLDTYYTTVGIRSFRFDVDKGFFLNDVPMKINGVCMHHDLGCLGAAVNKRAIERQLQILKEMGCNGIRCSHNPPTPELLQLCDQMGFIVMNEAFDMWYMHKADYDYGRYFEEWHERDLEALVKRDRNHPSVFMWSIGNEVLEQWTRPEREPMTAEQANILLNFGFSEDQLATESETLSVNSMLCRKLADFTRNLDPTRPVTAGCNEVHPSNHLFRSGALDIIGFNYHHDNYKDVHQNFPGKPFIATETVSGLMTRGYYRMPASRHFIWPVMGENPDSVLVNEHRNSGNLCSSYDNCFVPWGTFHENSLRYVKNNDFVSGQYVWTGFDYIGEPTPFSFPSRSSYFGIIDLAGFPKDVYYMYQSEWTDSPVLHLFPHWNWEEGQDVDLWVYYSQADEVELFINGKSQGKKHKGNDDFHVAWRVKFEPGTIKAVSRKAGRVVLEKEIHTAGAPAGIRMTADRDKIQGDGKDLSFITVEVVDKDGNLCPNATNLIHFEVEGAAFIAGVDNGNPQSMERFKDNKRKAFYGKCLVVLQNNKQSGRAILKASADGLKTSEIKIVNISHK